MEHQDKGGEIIKPSYWVCGGGGNLNCPNWDDINGCWRDCRQVYDDKCDPPDEEDYDGEFSEEWKDMGDVGYD